MIITVEIKPAKLAELFSSAIEGGDPVTTARRGGWCEGIYMHGNRRAAIEGDAPWYTRAEAFTGPFALKVVEVTDETQSTLKAHKISHVDVARGLMRMAEVFPDAFADVLKGAIDAPTADAFLQAVVFGEEKYA